MKKSWITRRDEDEIVGGGTGGNDRYYGYAIRDVYDGRGGNDLIRGDKGGDRLSGSGGNDSIYGENGDDEIFGGGGNDTLSGGVHADHITGGSGADIFFFSAWGVYGGSQLDVITDFDPRARGEQVFLSIVPDFEITTFADLKAIMVQDGEDVVMSFGGLDMLVLEDTRIGQLSAEDFHIYLA